MADQKKRSLRACIVGAGLMGRWHAAAVAAIGAEVVAAVDPDADAARDLVARHEGAKGFSSLQDALQNVTADVVHVCAPLPAHFDLTTLALERGAHVLVEKPLARNAAETASLMELARRYDRLLTPVHQFTFQRGVIGALERLSEFGEIQHLSMGICSAGGDRGGSANLDQIVEEILPHPLSVAAAFGLSADDGSIAVLSPRPGEMTAVWTSHSSSGVSVLLSMSGRPPRNRGSLVASKATIHFDFFHGYSFTERSWTSRWRKAVSPFEHSSRNVLAGGTNLLARARMRESAYPGLRELIRQFYEAAANGGPSPVTPDSILRIAEVRDRIVHLAAEARAGR